MVLRPVTTPDVEVATIQLSIGGEIVTTKEGVSLYDVIYAWAKSTPIRTGSFWLIAHEGKKYD